MDWRDDVMRLHEFVPVHTAVQDSPAMPKYQPCWADTTVTWSVQSRTTTDKKRWPIHHLAAAVVVPVVNPVRMVARMVAVLLLVAVRLSGLIDGRNCDMFFLAKHRHQGIARN